MDPQQALALLRTANEELTTAEQAGYPAGLTTPLRAEVTAGLDRLYGVVHVASTDAFSFPASAGAVHLTTVVRGADGAPYVLDTGTKTVWRIDLAKKAASPVYKSGQNTGFGKVGDPKILTVGGPDVLILDVKNILWRWRPIGTAGKGTLVKVNVSGSTTWGTDVTVLSTFVSNFSSAYLQALRRGPVRAEHPGAGAQQRRVGLHHARHPAAARHRAPWTASRRC